MATWKELMKSMKDFKCMGIWSKEHRRRGLVGIEPFDPVVVLYLVPRERAEPNQFQKCRRGSSTQSYHMCQRFQDGVKDLYPFLSHTSAWCARPAVIHLLTRRWTRDIPWAGPRRWARAARGYRTGPWGARAAVARVPPPTRARGARARPESAAPRRAPPWTTCGTGIRILTHRLEVTFNTAFKCLLLPNSSMMHL